jgi:hypothetical protein
MFLVIYIMTPLLEQDLEVINKININRPILDLILELLIYRFKRT